MTDTDPRRILDALLARCRESRTPCGDGHMVWRTWSDGADDRPPVVLMHGGSGAWTHWVRTIPALAPHRRVIAPDLPGCGDSDDPPSPYDAESLAALLAEGLDHALPGDAPFDLVAFSFSGMLAGLIAAAQARRLRHLVVVGSPILGFNREGPANFLTAVPADASPGDAARIYRANLQKMMVRDPDAVDDLAMTLHVANMARARLRSRSIARRWLAADTLRGLSCRLSFIYGADDVTLLPDVDGIRAHVAETHPDAGFHVVADAGHWVQYEAAEAFNRILVDALAG
jgi:2-hydroxy-6-oxonona-2,4-dienedioate hydrolase